MKLRTASVLLFGLALAACSSDDEPAVDDRNLHVASPDWREQIIYFVFTDRFENGDPSNDDQGAGEFDPSDFRKYSGGDLQGVIDRLDYIEGLGATAVWITPPVANQWWDPRAQFGGFHGYWARHLQRVDEHQGTLETYKDLSHALHERQMYLVQDIVPNHMGNFFSYDGPYDPSDPTRNFVLNSESVPTARPEQAPFDLVDVTEPAERDAAIYHFTPSISDFTDPVQEKTYALSDLDDLNTENPVVQDALRESYGYWVKEVGVDAVRIDTVKFIPEEFWPDFLYAEDEDAPGLERVAEATGRDDFLSFGEIFETSEPFSDAAEQKISGYLGTNGAPSLDSALAFPLYGSLIEVLAEGQPTARLGYRMQTMMDPSLVPNPFITPTFLDNHDVQRFLARGSEAALEQGLLLLMTLPGIPVIYQGTEQGFTEPRQAMFAEGWGAGGVDHFDTESSLYARIAELAAMRTSHRVLTRGDLTVLRTNRVRSGPLAFRRQHEGTTALVLINTSPEPVLMDAVDTGLPPGTVLSRLGGSSEMEDIVVPEGGSLLLELPARFAAVMATTGETESIEPPGATVEVDTAVEGQTFTASTTFSGTASGVDRLLMVVDDRLAAAEEVTVDPDGAWDVELDISAFAYGETEHTVTFYAPDVPVASSHYTFFVNRTFDGQIIEIDDPPGDDVGPDGNYEYPEDGTFGDQMDILHLTIEAGATLTLRFEMAELTTVWSPQNGFDHVSFNIYFDLPGEDGLTVLPQLQAEAPDDFGWSYTHFAFGWANNLHSTDGATATEMGASVPAAPEIMVDEGARTIAFTYDPTDFGIDSWEGVKVYATTWDFDGIDARYRDLVPDGAQWHMTGPEDGPKIMDDVGPILIPEP